MSSQTTEYGFEFSGPRRPCSVIETCMYHRSEPVFTVGDYRCARLRGGLAGGGRQIPQITLGHSCPSRSHELLQRRHGIGERY